VIKRLVGFDAARPECLDAIAVVLPCASELAFGSNNFVAGLVCSIEKIIKALWFDDNGSEALGAVRGSRDLTPPSGFVDYLSHGLPSQFPRAFA